MAETKLGMKKTKTKKTNKQMFLILTMIILVYNQHCKEYVEVIENIKK